MGYVRLARERSLSLYGHRVGLQQVRAVAITLADNATASVSGGAATFTDRAAGAAAEDRWLWALLSAESDASFTGCTIGGVAAELVAGPVRNTGASPDVGSAIYRRKLPSGATATVVASIASGNVGLTLLRVVGGRGLVVAAGTSAANGAATGQVSLDVSARGGAIAVLGNNSTGAIAWTNITETTDFSVGSDRHSAAFRHDAIAAAAAALVSDAGINSAMCAASLR